MLNIIKKEAIEVINWNIITQMDRNCITHLMTQKKKKYQIYFAKWLRCEYAYSFKCGLDTNSLYIDWGQVSSMFCWP